MRGGGGGTSGKPRQRVRGEGFYLLKSAQMETIAIFGKCLSAWFL